MHVLFTTPPTPGHVYPTLPLVENLVDRGHRVTYISGPSLTSELHLTGASVVDLGWEPDTTALAATGFTAETLSADLRAFLENVPSDLLVVLDEAYFEYLRLPENQAYDALELRREFPNLVILRTFSKAFSLAGVRVGYLPQDARERTERLRQLEAHALRSGQTQLFIETPYRNAALWTALLQGLQPGTRLAVASGLTLPQMQLASQTVQQWRAAPCPVDNRTPAVFALGS